MGFKYPVALSFRTGTHVIMKGGRGSRYSAENDKLSGAQDPWWKATFDEVGKVNEKISRAAVQNPLEYRATALAAVQIGSRPHDLGLDAEQAASFCTRFMS